MSGVRIDYGNFAVGAKENFVATATDKENFVDLYDLQKEYISSRNIVNPCDLYSTVLDGMATAVPSDTEQENLGFWSNQLSQEDGSFLHPIVLTLTSSALFSSEGVTFTFDTYNGIFCKSLNIKWYQNDELLSDLDFSPDSAYYFCRNQVEYYNKIIITFYNINMPYNRLKLRNIEYGRKISFYGDELRSVKLIQEIDPISTKVPINICDFTLDSKNNVEYHFQEKQPLSIYFNDDLKATSFVSKSKRKSKNIWSVQTEDYIGLLENVVFYGGIYYEKLVVDLLKEIFDVAKVPYHISDDVKGNVTGHIPYTNCREALKQIAIAAGLVIDTSGSDGVDVYVLSEEISQTIPATRIMAGQSFEDQTRVTSVEVLYHEYIEDTEKITLYDAKKEGVGNNILIKFTNPVYNWRLTKGAVISFSNNHILFNAISEDCILEGYQYIHKTYSRKKDNPLVLANEIENVVSISNATLVSSNNIDKVLERCYNYYINNRVINLKIVEGKHEQEGPVTYYGDGLYGAFLFGGKEGSVGGIVYDPATKVGDKIFCETEYLGDLKGRITKQTFKLSGGIIIKDTIMNQGG